MELPAELTAPSQDVVMVSSMLKSNAITELPMELLDLATNSANGLPPALLPHVTRDLAAHLALELEIPPQPAAMVDQTKLP